MFNLQPTPPPPLQSLILRTILQHLHGRGYGVPVPGHRPITGFPPTLQPPVQVNPGPIGDPTLGSGPNQPAQSVPGTRLPPPTLQPPVQVPGVIAPDPYGGGGHAPIRSLHRIISGLL